MKFQFIAYEKNQRSLDNAVFRAEINDSGYNICLGEDSLFMSIFDTVIHGEYPFNDERYDNLSSNKKEYYSNKIVYNLEKYCLLGMLKNHVDLMDQESYDAIKDGGMPSEYGCKRHYNRLNMASELQYERSIPQYLENKLSSLAYENSEPLKGDIKYRAIDLAELGISQYEINAYVKNMKYLDSLALKEKNNYLYASTSSGVSDRIVHAAMDFRKQLGLGEKGAIADQILDKLEKIGFALFYTMFPANINGVSVSYVLEETFDKVRRRCLIFINRNDDYIKRLFSIAHELGHSILWHYDKDSSTELHEEEASHFANTFLLPPEDVRERFLGYNIDKLRNDYKSTNSLLKNTMNEFQVGIKTIYYALEYANIISKADRIRLSEEFDVDADKPKRDKKYEQCKNTVYNNRIAEALKNERISSSEAEDMRVSWD
ncbi:MAG: ImmA/IrrE family metallo-endopeptidase [Deferribacteraceae bacterium]|nr:ImmA/IrrE family metallo-endopeptidase [Deferribacteraceae bacterium]